MVSCWRWSGVLILAICLFAHSQGLPVTQSSLNQTLQNQKPVVGQDTVNSVLAAVGEKDSPSVEVATTKKSTTLKPTVANLMPGKK